MHVHYQPRFSRQREAGYVMLTLLLTLALLVIFAAIILPSITFDIRRDREEEMIHRGTQYSRAIRAYYKKFQRYPTKIEDLENSNNMRFLRKRYKDPLTGKDFKLLHFGEVKLTMSGGIGGGSIPGANPIGGAMNAGQAGGLAQPSTFGGNSGFGANSNSSFGQNQNPPAANSQTAPADPSQAGSQTSSGANGSDTKDSGSSSDKLAGVTFGGGPIVGVASTSKKDTIREFDHKKKYNEWQFIYDPTMDRGGIITTPNQPQLQGFGQVQNVNGPNGTPQPGAFGSGSPFGNSPTGMQNNPTPPTTGYGNPNQPSNPPQQQ